MEADQITFTMNGIVYLISSHIWRNNPTRVRQVTVERIMDTISQPDIQVAESQDVTLYWKWFPEVGSGNFLKVVVKARTESHLVVTAHPDENRRKLEERNL